MCLAAAETCVLLLEVVPGLHAITSRWVVFLRVCGGARWVAATSLVEQLMHAAVVHK